MRFFEENRKGVGAKIWKAKFVGEELWYCLRKCVKGEKTVRWFS